MKNVDDQLKTDAHMTKSLIPNVIDGKTARAIASHSGHIELFDPLIHPLVRIVQKEHRVSTAHPSYSTVEHNQDGHGWHTDTGNSGHMTWCVLTASVLLTPPSSFAGGEFFYRDSENAHFHYRDMMIHTSDEEHCVRPHTGERKVLLMFFKGGKSEDSK